MSDESVAMRVCLREGDACESRRETRIPFGVF
jgi:hypothetical protein